MKSASGGGEGREACGSGQAHTDDDVGIVRLMFPDSKQSEHQHLVEISWDEFFEKFEESKLTLIYDEESLFSKLIKRNHGH